MRAKMGPMLPDIYCFPFYDVSYDDETCEKECIADIERAFATYLPAEEVAAVIIEPVQGDAGLLAGHPIFMKKLYDLCKKNGILFISEDLNFFVALNQNLGILTGKHALLAFSEVDIFCAVL